MGALLEQVLLFNVVAMERRYEMAGWLHINILA